MTDLACVAHVHSTYSDGSATLPELLADARAAAADVLLLTDHNTLGAKRDGWEGWHDGVLLLVGVEVSRPPGHYLAFGLKRQVARKGLSQPQLAAAVAAAGGVGFAAHPFSIGSQMERGNFSKMGRAHPWTTLEDCPEAGLELWSLTTDAAEDWRSPWQAVRYLLAPERHTDGPRPAHLRTWDELGRRRRVPALGGIDAHQRGFRVGRRVLSPVPNRRYFRILRTHVVLDGPPSGELAADRAAILGALGAGRSYLACDFRAPATGFAFAAEGPDGTVPMGAEAPAGGHELVVRAPRAAALRLVADGETLAAADDATELRAAAPGPAVYRAEARLGGRTWILSNAIYLR
jgi:hypothetical protein